MSHQNLNDEGASDSLSKKMGGIDIKTGTENETVKKENCKEKTRTEEEFIFLLLNVVLKDAQKYFSVTNDQIIKSIHELKDNFKSFTYLNLDFSRSEYLCGYFYRYGRLDAAVVRNRILDAVVKCENFRFKIFEQKTEINVISLGSGPGTDILGFCSALEEYSLTKGINKQQVFNITTVDYVKRWSSFSNLIQFYIREGNYGNASAFFKKHNVSFNFMCVDLFNQTPPMKYENDLKEADIVLLSRVLDVQNRDKINPNDILKVLIPRMKKDGLLLLIDSFSMRYDTEGLTEIYRSDLQPFTLTFTQVENISLEIAKQSKAEIAVYSKTASTD